MGASFQKKFPATQLELQEGKAKISLKVDSSYHHAGGAMHGFVYFRILDEVTYFAAMTYEKEYFYLTKSFNIRFTRPFQEGLIVAESEEIKYNGDEVIVTGSLYNEEGTVLATGEGVFKKSKIKLSPEIGYRLDQ